jgi:outer membrane protein OmpA-like peptidoglycan-associated protein
VIAEIDVTADNPLADASARAALDSWAALLMVHPEAQVALLVHAGDADREAGLARSTEQAAQLREYLLIAGAAESHVVAIGMGAAEPLVSPDAPDASRINARLEIERLR